MMGQRGGIKRGDYIALQGCDFVLESVDGGTKSYITGQRGGIERGDYIALKSGSDATLYQVVEIDYYSDPPDMCIALLEKAND